MKRYTKNSWETQDARTDDFIARAIIEISEDQPNPQKLIELVKEACDLIEELVRFNKTRQPLLF